MIELVRAYVEDDPSPEDAARLASWRDDDTLARAFETPLTFGTSGVRSRVAPGPAYLNLRAVLRLTAAAFARFRSDDTARVVIGFDARTHSRAFAEAAASLVARLGGQAALFDVETPTPAIVHAGRHRDAAFTLVFTASHNPREDHGLKIYVRGGHPLTEPDDAILTAALHGPEPSPRHVALGDLDADDASRVARLGDDARGEYVREARAFARRFACDEGPRLRVGYTALHGVGQREVLAVLDGRPFDVRTVASQGAPDGSFPTLRSPNPEHANALDRLRALCIAEGLDLGLANDPDADRLAVLVRHGDALVALTGDELGTLLGDAALRHGLGDDDALDRGGRRFVLTTLPSSRWLAALARTRGADHEVTLTGHKWIDLRRSARERAGDHFVFGYEEALGYAFPTSVRDKDGIVALGVFAEIARALSAHGETAIDALERLAREVGLHRTAQRTFPADARTRDVIAALRREPPREFAGERVAAVLDGESGTRHADGASSPLGLPRSSLFGLELSGGGRVLVRPSGTEPKVKLYLERIEPLAPGTSYLDAAARMDASLAALGDVFAAALAAKGRAA